MHAPQTTSETVPESAASQPAKLLRRVPTPAQQAASRANGAKSRGPRSSVGKLNSRRNALRHGRFAAICALGLDTPAGLNHERAEPDGFARLHAALVDEFQPQTQVERDLVENIASARWRNLRAWSQEKIVLDTAMDQFRAAAAALPSHEESNSTDLEPLYDGLGFQHLADSSQVLSAIDRFENRYQRIFHRSIRELSRLRAERQREARELKNEQSNRTTHSIQRAEEETNPADPSPLAFAFAK